MRHALKVERAVRRSRRRNTVSARRRALMFDTRNQLKEMY